VTLLRWIEFQSLNDQRGNLVAVEIGPGWVVPFDVKRVYYMFDTGRGVSRGFHAHRELKQVAVCLAGRCRMVLDDGMRREESWLDSPTRGLLIEGMVWREMHDFSPDCVLLVFASEHYDEDDYIRDYEVFKGAVSR
jgi:dTDP-4-dehydrorhamnose 3,5-epimerase-like enzyme